RAWLIADWLSPSRSPARVTLRSSTRVSKTRRRFRSRERKCKLCMCAMHNYRLYATTQPINIAQRPMNDWRVVYVEPFQIDRAEFGIASGRHGSRAGPIGLHVTTDQPADGSLGCDTPGFVCQDCAQSGWRLDMARGALSAPGRL